MARRAREASTDIPTPGSASPGTLRPSRRRRRPLVYVVGAALVILGILLALFAFQATSKTHSVIAVRNNVARGATITAADLQTVQVGVDPALHPIAGNKLQQVVGKRAAMDLAAGGILTQQQLADTVEPGAGKSVVGLNLASGQMPAKKLQPGDRVRIIPVATAAAGQTNAKPSTPISGTVVGINPDPGSATNTIVNVEVESAVAVDLATAAGTGKLVLVLDSRER